MLDAKSGPRALLEVAARVDASDQPLDIAVATELCFRAMTVLAQSALEGAREDYTVALQAMMHAPQFAIDEERDALVDERDFLGCLDVIDLLSAEGLDCVAPRLHRGWQDRHQSCRQARRVSSDKLGFSLAASERAAIVAAWGVCHRVMRIPPPVSFAGKDLLRTRGPLLDLIAKLAPGDDLTELIAKLKR
jgi:hypothetical protein